MDTNIIEKIKKLLRMADASRGGSPAECEQALARAQQLITEHQLSELEFLDLDGNGKAQVVGKDTIKCDREKKDIDNYIGQILIQVCQVRVVWVKYYNDKQVECNSYVLVGHELDRQWATSIYNMLIVAMPTALLQYLHSNRINRITESVKNSYYQGLQTGFIKACREGGIMAHKQASAETNRRHGLMVVDKAKSIQLWMDNNIPTRPCKSKSFRSDNNAFNAGHARGSTLDIGHSKIA
jgi:hypothetical protein